jgi:SAM-dependent methyltransferase
MPSAIEGHKGLKGAALAFQPPIGIELAIETMLDEFRHHGNVWMLNEHWPLNEPHVRLMVADVMAHFPPGPHVHLFDVGCFNGYISLMFRRIGYSVTGTDAYNPAERQPLFDKAGIEFVPANLNDLNPFAQLPAGTFDVVIIAQVIEHVLNHPLGLVRELARVMRSGGMMILTTPNPATVMGALRILRGGSSMWGSLDFIDQPKIKDHQIITKGDIHYHEYTYEELCHLITGAGLYVEQSRYLGLGIPHSQSAVKRMLKRNLVLRKLMSKRLFASNHYFLVRKPVETDK